MYSQNDDTDTETAAPQTATPQQTDSSPSNAANNADRSRRIYERIFAEAISEAPSKSVVTLPPVAEARYSLLVSSAATACSYNSAPTDEEEWVERNEQQQQQNIYDTTAESVTSTSEAAVATEDEASLSHHQQQQQQQDLTGGRLWRLAGEVAAGRASLLMGKSRSGPVGHFAETFLERMRSRADPDALIAPPTPPRHNLLTSQSIMVKMTSSSSDDYREDEAFLMNTGLAHKRVRVVQLLIIGLVGILLAWLGNFFVSRSCYFAAVPVAVGQNGDVFPLHFGLWNYSPADSALNGYKYCYPYGGSHRTDGPVLSRAFNLAALLAGTYSLVVLWWYLISGRIVPKFWKAAVYAAVGAGALQLATPLFFFMGRMCRKSSCTAGPAAALSAITAVVWVILAAELHYHCPIVGVDDVHDTCAAEESLASALQDSTGSKSTPVAQLEMSDLAGASQEYFDRFHKKHTSRRRYRPPDLT